MQIPVTSADRVALAPLLLLGILWTGTDTRAAPVVISAGRENWLHPWVPDLRDPAKRIAIRPERRIDVVILADGYLASERRDFDTTVEKWYRRFLTFPAWGEFRGAFRVRAIWTPSRTRATADQKSHFAVGIENKSVTNTRAKETAAAIFAALDQLDVNQKVAGKRYTHLVAAVLIKDEGGRNPSGVAKTVQSPDDGTVLLVGFGADSHHEFAHAFGGLRDEYVNVADSQAKGKTPDRPSLLAVSNLSYTNARESLPWRHLYQKAFNVRARIQAQNQKDAQAGLSKSPLLVRPE